MNMRKQKLAVCDFDGTLSKGYVSMEFLDYLYERKAYSKDSYKEQMRLVELHKQGRLGYDDWCYQWGEVWAQGLKGQSTEKIAEHAASMFMDFKRNIYHVSYDIINHLEQTGYYVVCLSLGAFEVINLAAKELGMHKTYATRLASEKGIYTGKPSTDLHTPLGKEVLLQKIMKEYDPANSIGLADSNTDIGFLKLLEHPIAANPSEKMLAYANHNNWKIINLDKPGHALSVVKELTR